MSARKPKRGVQLPTMSRLPYVVEVSGRTADQRYLYYRRAGRRVPLPQPEGSAAFLDAYATAEAMFRVRGVRDGRTVHDAIGAYLSSADFQQHARATSGAP